MRSEYGGTRFNRDTVAGRLYEEMLVTRQTSTGNGEAWIPLAADGPDAGFRGTARDITRASPGLRYRNDKARHRAVVGEFGELQRAAKALGVKAGPLPADPMGCTGCGSCAPMARVPFVQRRARLDVPRWWRPVNPNRLGRHKRRDKEILRTFRGNVMGQRDRRPVDAETRRRQLRARAKDSGITVRNGQLIREDATE